MITGKIDCTKIDKTKLFKGKEGAMYLDIVLIDTPNSKYGHTHMIVQQVTKEEREAGKKGNVLGNAKIIGGQRPGEGYSDRGESSSGLSATSESELPF